MRFLPKLPRPVSDAFRALQDTLNAVSKCLPQKHRRQVLNVLFKFHQYHDIWFR